MRFNSSKIKELLCKHKQNYSIDAQKIEEGLKSFLKMNKCLNRQKFIELCMWKSPRPKKSYEDEINSDDRVKLITSLSFSSKDEYFKVESLQLLKGVSYPVASVILHFAFPDEYMIIDFRTIWSLGWQEPKKYDFLFWEKYIKHVRELATNHKISLRDLDKVPWQYSKENQKNE